jgi:hypothetical protein
MLKKERGSTHSGVVSSPTSKLAHFTKSSAPPDLCLQCCIRLISFTLGRLPQIPTTAITVELPHISEQEDNQPWMHYGDGARARQPGARSTTFYEVASLSKIVNSTLLLFFAPSQTMKGSLLLDEYHKYTSWYRRLPSIVASTEDAPPHVICLQ